MEYPKPIMSLSELKELGFPADLLYQAANAKNSGSFKTGVMGKTSKWYFKTDEFDQWLSRMTKGIKRYV